MRKRGIVFSWVGRVQGRVEKEWENRRRSWKIEAWKGHGTWKVGEEERIAERALEILRRGMNRGIVEQTTIKVKQFV